MLLFFKLIQRHKFQNHIGKIFDFFALKNDIFEDIFLNVIFLINIFQD